MTASYPYVICVISRGRNTVLVPKKELIFGNLIAFKYMVEILNADLSIM